MLDGNGDAERIRLDPPACEAQFDPRLDSALATRRSVRRYKPDPLPPGLVNALLHAAIAAPSAHNRQPWRFAVLEQLEDKTRLAEAMGGQLQLDRLRDGDSADVVAADVDRSRKRICSAPVVIVACADLSAMDHYLDGRRIQAEQTMAVQSVAAAIQNLLIAAHAVGLGGCWMCAPLFCPETVARCLGIPETWTAQALVTLGFPAASSRVRPRRPLSEVLWRPPALCR